MVPSPKGTMFDMDWVAIQWEINQGQGTSCGVGESRPETEVLMIRVVGEAVHAIVAGRIICVPFSSHLGGLVEPAAEWFCEGAFRWCFLRADGFAESLPLS